MSAVLFGSIGTIAETSELQRRAFNEAFTHHGLNWHWSRETYITLLQTNGGQRRIEDYACSQGQTVNAQAIHQTKSESFRKYLNEASLTPRPGVVETIQKTKQAGLKLGLVTTTSQANVVSLLTAVGQHIDTTNFDLILDASHVQQAKPAPDIYLLALTQLEETPEQCVAIEDNPGGLRAAQVAAVPCAAFPGGNTAHYEYAGAAIRTEHLQFDELQTLIAQL